MRIDSKYRMYWADGDCFAILERNDHILQYSATNQISEDGTYGLNLSYTRNYYRKQGYTTGVYITFTEYGDYYAVYDNPFSSVYLAIPEEQSIELNQFNYWNVDIDYSLHFTLPYPTLPIIQFRLTNESADTIQVKNISITSISKSITPICQVSAGKEYLHKYEDTDNRTLSLTVGTPSDMPQGVQCFYACLPPNDFPANDLTFTITYTRNGVEETVTKTNTKPLQLRHGMKAINIDIA